MSQARAVRAQTEALLYRIDAPKSGGSSVPDRTLLPEVVVVLMLLERRLVQIGEATHIVLLEKNRLQLYREVQAFLDE